MDVSRMILKLLSGKNRNLQKFLAISEEFLAVQARGEKLDQLLARREACIKASDLFDRKISDLIPTLSPSERGPQLSERVRTLISEREVLLARISKVDERLSSWIEAEKSDLARELAVSRKNREILGRFKSGLDREHGEELDEKV